MENTIEVEDECPEEVISSSVNELSIWTDKLVKTLKVANPPPIKEKKAFFFTPEPEVNDLTLSLKAEDPTILEFIDNNIGNVQDRGKRFGNF